MPCAHAAGPAGPRLPVHPRLGRSLNICPSFKKIRCFCFFLIIQKNPSSHYCCSPPGSHAHALVLTHALSARACTHVHMRTCKKNISAPTCTGAPHAHTSTHAAMHAHDCTRRTCIALSTVGKDWCNCWCSLVATSSCWCRWPACWTYGSAFFLPYQHPPKGDAAPRQSSSVPPDKRTNVARKTSCNHGEQQGQQDSQGLSGKQQGEVWAAAAAAVHVLSGLEQAKTIGVRRPAACGRMQCT